MKPAIFILSILISLTISNAQDSAQKLQAQQMSHTVKELQAKIVKLDKLIQKLQFQVLNQEVGAVPGEALSVEIAASWRRRAGKYLSKKGISHRGVTQCGSPASDHIGCNAVLFLEDESEDGDWAELPCRFNHKKGKIFSHMCWY